jgi:alkylation response protein AidB-like acyl-CoA dehydrogenase
MADSTPPAGASFLVSAPSPEETVIPDDLGQEERMLVGAVEDFAAQEVAPRMDAVTAGDHEVKRELFMKAAELGIFMAEVPEDMGGLDLNVLAITGMCSSDADLGGLGSMVYGHQGIGMLPIVNFGTEDQVEKYLFPCMEGAMVSAFALTEPGTGSDAMNIKTRAVLSEDGSHYVVNGSKQWITNASLADIFILFAKVDGELFTAFILDRFTDGIEVGEPERLLGQHGSDVAGLTLENVRIPTENVLGEVGKGHKVALCTLNMGRLKLAAGNATGAKKAVAQAARYAGERHQFGRPIAEFGLIQRTLSDMAARAYASDAMAYRTAGLVYQALEAMEARGEVTLETKLAALAEFSVECAMAKVYTSEAYNGLADDAIQVFGGYGFSEEYVPARMYRDSRITRIYEGTNEICRLYSQRAILKKWAAGSLDLTPGDAAPVSDGVGFGTMPERIAALKATYRRLAAAVVAHVGPEAVADAEHQQFLGSLAEVAIEIYAAESAYLRVAKLAGRPDDGHHHVREALAELAMDRAVDRIRTEARTILGETSQRDQVRSAMSMVDAELPAPVPLMQARALVATKLVSWNGVVPQVTV